MSPVVNGILRFGYRRWYERQLVEGHAWLVVCVLAILLSAAGFELLAIGRGAAELAFDAAVVGGGMLLGALAWRRYARTMMNAQFIGSQADCPACGRHGFQAERDGSSSRRIAARCRRCAHQWGIEPPPS